MERFSQKMINSGHSVLTTKITMVQGVTKFLDILRASNLDIKDKNYRPMHKGAEFRESERQISKYMGKMSWLKGEKEKSSNWRDLLRGIWKGKPPIQRPVRNVPYTTVLQIPNTPDSISLRELAKREPRLTKITRYSSKLVE